MIVKKSFVAIFSAAAIAVSSLGSTIAYGSVFADINDVPWSGAVTYIDEAYSLGLMAVSLKIMLHIVKRFSLCTQ